MRNELQKSLRYLCVVATLLTIGVWVSIVQRFVEPKPAMAQTKKLKYDIYVRKDNKVLPLSELGGGSPSLWGDDMGVAIQDINRKGFKIHSFEYSGANLNDRYIILVEK